MEVDIIFDTVCPWCFIGKRRLEQALALRPNVDIKPRWRPFLLNPEMPAGGIDRTAYLVKKFGSEARVRRIYGAIGEAGQSVEIDFAFERIARTPNSVDSHRLIRYASGLAHDADGLVKDRSAKDRTGHLVEALFLAYFIEGRDIGDRGILLKIAEDHGLDRAEVQAFLDSDDSVSYVYEENARAHKLGINGVPSYLFNGRMVISGAQEPQVLSRLLDAAVAAA